MPRHNQEEWNTMFTCINTIHNCFKFWENVRKSFRSRSLSNAKMSKKNIPPPKKKSFRHCIRNFEQMNEKCVYIYVTVNNRHAWNSVKSVSLKVTGQGKLGINN